MTQASSHPNAWLMLRGRSRDAIKAPSRVSTPAVLRGPELSSFCLLAPAIFDQAQEKVLNKLAQQRKGGLFSKCDMVKPLITVKQLNLYDGRVVLEGEDMLSGVQDPILVYVIAPPMVSWGLERLVQSAHPGLELAGTAASVDESLRGLGQNAIDVVLLDLEGDDADRSVPILQAATRAKLLVLTGSHNLAMLDRAVLAGVRGVVRKSVAPSLLLKAIQKIHEGELWIDRGATGRIFMEIARRKAAEDPEKSKIATLTVRERRTIAAVTSHASLPAKVLADHLCISEHTLRNHLTSIYSKLGLTNRVDLYVFAKRYSLNEPNELYSAPRPKPDGHA